MTSTETKAWASLTWPNRISLLRLLLVAPFVVLVMNQGQWVHARHAALGVFVLMAISDAVDGMLARRLNQTSRLGAILDPLADKVLIVCSVVLLSLPASAVPGVKISNWAVVAVVGKDLWVVAGFIVVYLVTDRFMVCPTRAGKASTFGQLVMVVLVLVAPDINRLGRSAGSYLAAAAWWAVTGLSVLAVISYTRLGLRFVAAEGKLLDGEEAPPEEEE